VTAIAAQPFPRRDARGRVVSIGELFLAGLLAVLVALAGLALIDGVLALVGLSEFGQASGWLAVILPALLFFDDVRAWRGRGVRFLVAPVAAVLAIALGLVGSAAVAALPPMLSGAVGAAIAAGLYGPVWFVGIRWLTGEW
jgi:hypothetical protein